MVLIDYPMTTIHSMNSFFHGKHGFKGIGKRSFKVIPTHPIQSKDYNIFLKVTPFDCIVCITLMLSHSEKKYRERNLDPKFPISKQTHVSLQSHYVYTWWISSSSLTYVIHQTLSFHYNRVQDKRNTQLNLKTQYCNRKVNTRLKVYN